MSSKKLDLYKLHKDQYITPKTPQLMETQAAKYLSITGKGAPGGEAFVKKVQALYNVAFTIKMSKKSDGKDYAVCKLEGLWWGSGGKADFSDEPQSEWNWNLIIRTPDFVMEKDLAAAKASLLDKGKEPIVEEVKLEMIEEGLCVQMLHQGPYAREGESIAGMKAFAEAKGLALHGLHHEIYLSDPRRVPPERLQTILRMPVK